MSRPNIQEEISLLTWNINGIRSFKNDALKQVLDSLDSDIICLQETKVSRDMLDEATALVDGYTAYFAFCRKKGGYSGVVTYCRSTATPVRAEEGLSGVLAAAGSAMPDLVGSYGTAIMENFSPQELKDLDFEGRAVITQHAIVSDGGSESLLSVINVYCPRVDPEKPDRLKYKLDFLRLLQLRWRALRAGGSKVIVVGDLNISHKMIDHCDPSPEIDFCADPCRQWLTGVLGGCCADGGKGDFVDAFRHLHSDRRQAFTCWNTMINARATNYGTRIDYVLVDAELADALSTCDILADVLGSDHCPVRAAVRARPVESTRCPSSCSRYFPEFSGKQVKLTDFMKLKRKQLDDGEVSVQTESPGTTRMAKVKRQQSITSFFGSNVRPVDTLDSATLGNNVPKPCSKQAPNDTSVDLKNGSTNTKNASTNATGLWKKMLCGPKPTPLCKVHREPCAQRRVTKKGANLNRKFWVCARGGGRVNDPEARCDFFEWY